MTPEQLAFTKALLASATPRPWRHHEADATYTGDNLLTGPNANCHLPKLKRLTKKEAIETPVAFRDALIEIVLTPPHKSPSAV